MVFGKQVKKVETTGNKVVQALNAGIIVSAVALIVAVVALVIAVRS